MFHKTKISCKAKQNKLIFKLMLINNVHLSIKQKLKRFFFKELNYLLYPLSSISIVCGTAFTVDILFL